MSKYEITGPAKDCVMIRTKVETNKYGGWKYQYFTGYDFMGGATWQDNFSFDKAISLAEAREIIKDLESADATAVNESEIGGPELSFEISECKAPLETVVKFIERKYPGWKFDRTESRYESCIMAIFTKP